MSSQQWIEALCGVGLVVMTTRMICGHTRKTFKCLPTSTTNIPTIWFRGCDGGHGFEGAYRRLMRMVGPVENKFWTCGDGEPGLAWGRAVGGLMSPRVLLYGMTRDSCGEVRV